MKQENNFIVADLIAEWLEKQKIEIELFQKTNNLRDNFETFLKYYEKLDINKIIEDLNTLLKDIIYCNKDVIIVETFFYKIIPIIYSTNTKK